MTYPYVWTWRYRTIGPPYPVDKPVKVAWFGDGIDRAGQRCRVLVRDRTMNSALVEFVDGYRVITSRGGLRRAAAQSPGHRPRHPKGHPMTAIPTPADLAGIWPAVTARLARVQALADDIDRATPTGPTDAWLQVFERSHGLASTFADQVDVLLCDAYDLGLAAGRQAAQETAADRPTAAAGSPTAPGEGDGQDTTPPDAQQAPEPLDLSTVDADLYEIRDCYDPEMPGSRWTGEALRVADQLRAEVDRLRGHWHWYCPRCAADALRRYADRHHAHPGGPTNLIQTLTIREAAGAIYDYDACRSCSARLDEHGQCTGERERLLLAAQRIAAGDPDVADPPRPGTGWTPEEVNR